MTTFDEILKENMLYIYKVAKDLNCDNDEDLIQIGRISMYNSYVKYNDSESNFQMPFMKFAGQAIRWAMMSYLTENTRLIHIPAHKVKEDIKKSPEKKKYNNKIVSTDIKIYKKDIWDTEYKTILDITPGLYGDWDKDINSLFTEKEILLLRNAMSKLKPSYRNVLELRYGINQPLEEELTFQQIGDITNGTSRENIRIAEKKAINKLRKILNVKTKDYKHKKIKKEQTYFSKDVVEKMRKSATERHKREKLLKNKQNESN